MSEYYLYARRGNRNAEDAGERQKVKTQRLAEGLFLPGETRSVKTGILRLYFAALSLGRAKIAYVSDDAAGRVVHTSYVLPKSFKFPFMKRGELEIGPCHTDKDYRGRGIYPAVLESVLDSEDTRFYMLVEESNAPSIRGIEKAGFRRVAICEKTPMLKRYIVSARLREE